LSPQIQAEMGINQSVVRLSVGLEHSSDLLRDFEQALN
jgi:cystathionine beta-lyase/cystathionine gamma-synthase